SARRGWTRAASPRPLRPGRLSGPRSRLALEQRDQARLLLGGVVVGEPVPDAGAPRHRQTALLKLGPQLLEVDALALCEHGRVLADVGLAAPVRCGGGEVDA